MSSASCYTFGQYVLKASQVFIRSRLSIAFVNRKPVVPGHVLVSPIRVVHRFRDMTIEEVSDLFLVSQLVSMEIQTHHLCPSFTLSMQDGKEAGQTVHHVHVHILPRKAGDFQNNDDIYTEIEKHNDSLHLDNPGDQWRSDEEMAEEASILRKLFDKKYTQNIE
ncbi:bis(5'-adenosyl)-triphosphatase-like [Anneissia japonica]|uniref:bis(5'-adenosyl)-triphosphatase-like n=1 Tax=Anneissia japonica TaxID=1529436 RepID=UPI00142596F4|nr:bis(5'-adenosyl)-triphosphatase-like [Anneissia japonica]XP_033109322.1 bis(5'-adenosyl)-triphosphatase-like [Anneissia japonica]XP_033109331.1 bis(5'-adenosyl)-triphosphatase-like [Anneissia japonica]